MAESAKSIPPSSTLPGNSGADSISESGDPNISHLFAPDPNVTIDPSEIEEAVKRAEAAIAKMAENFLPMAKADMARLAEELDKLGEAETPQDLKTDALYAIVHDIKGSSASLGRNLMSSVAASACDYLQRREKLHKPFEEPIIRAHMDAMEVIIAQNVTGDGGPGGARLIDKLKSIVNQRLEEGEGPTS